MKVLCRCGQHLQSVVFKQIILKNVWGSHPSNWKDIRTKTEVSQGRRSVSRLQHQLLLSDKTTGLFHRFQAQDSNIVLAKCPACWPALLVWNLPSPTSILPSIYLVYLYMCIHICVHICVYLYMCICVYMCIYVFICICVYICTHIPICIHLYKRILKSSRQK